MMTDTIKTLHITRHVKEMEDGRIAIQSVGRYNTLFFHNTEDLYEFLDQLVKLLPRPAKANLTDKYLGDPWKYDKF
jgi:hypothetical protein